MHHGFLNPVPPMSLTTLKLMSPFIICVCVCMLACECVYRHTACCIQFWFCFVFELCVWLQE